MTAEHDPGAVPPFQGKAEVHSGWTSNARAGSPMDLSSQTKAPSPYFKLDADILFTAPTGRWVRPEIEGNAVLQFFAAQDVRGESTAYLNAKGGLLAADSAPRAKFLYDFDALSIFGGDRYDDSPIWFYNAHRGEFELQLPLNLLVFAGGGKRTFREMSRTRIEFDGGIGAHIPAASGLGILCALTFRAHEAHNEAYDLRGTTVLLSGDIRIPKDWAMRATTLVSLDDYPLSSGYFDPSTPDVARSDTLLRLALTAFSPGFHGLRAGLGYEFANRWSTTDNYAYRDHRVMLKLTYTFSVDPFLPKRFAGAHTKIFDEQTQDNLRQRIQDLIRREDSARRSSSCVE